MGNLPNKEVEEESNPTESANHNTHDCDDAVVLHAVNGTDDSRRPKPENEGGDDDRISESDTSSLVHITTNDADEGNDVNVSCHDNDRTIAAEVATATSEKELLKEAENNAFVYSENSKTSKDASAISSSPSSWQDGCASRLTPDTIATTTARMCETVIPGNRFLHDNHHHNNDDSPCHNQNLDLHKKAPLFHSAGVETMNEEETGWVVLQMSEPNGSTMNRETTTLMNAVCFGQNSHRTGNNECQTWNSATSGGGNNVQEAIKGDQDLTFSGNGRELPTSAAHSSSVTSSSSSSIRQRRDSTLLQRSDVASSEDDDKLSKYNVMVIDAPNDQDETPVVPPPPMLAATTEPQTALSSAKLVSKLSDTTIIAENPKHTTVFVPAKVSPPAVIIKRPKRFEPALANRTTATPQWVREPYYPIRKKTVCLESKHHYGTLQWYEVLRSFSNDLDRYPEWIDTIADRVNEQLDQDGFYPVLVFRDPYGRPCNSFQDGLWVHALDKEVKEITRNQFLLNRKLLKEPPREESHGSDNHEGSSSGSHERYQDDKSFDGSGSPPSSEFPNKDTSDSNFGGNALPGKARPIMADQIRAVVGQSDLCSNEQVKTCEDMDSTASDEEKEQEHDEPEMIGYCDVEDDDDNDDEASQHDSSVKQDSHDNDIPSSRGATVQKIVDNAGGAARSKWFPKLLDVASKIRIAIGPKIPNRQQTGVNDEEPSDGRSNRPGPISADDLPRHSECFGWVKTSDQNAERRRQNAVKNYFLFAPACTDRTRDRMEAALKACGIYWLGHVDERKNVDLQDVSFGNHFPSYALDGIRQAIAHDIRRHVLDSAAAAANATLASEVHQHRDENEQSLLGCREGQSGSPSISNPKKWKPKKPIMFDVDANIRVVIGQHAYDEAKTITSANTRTELGTAPGTSSIQDASKRLGASECFWWAPMRLESVDSLQKESRRKVAIKNYFRFSPWCSEQTCIRMKRALELLEIYFVGWVDKNGRIVQEGFTGDAIVISTKHQLMEEDVASILPTETAVSKQDDNNVKEETRQQQLSKIERGMAEMNIISRDEADNVTSRSDPQKSQQASRTTSSKPTICSSASLPVKPQLPSEKGSKLPAESTWGESEETTKVRVAYPAKEKDEPPGFD